jgi:hypothetical protein
MKHISYYRRYEEEVNANINIIINHLLMIEDDYFNKLFYSIFI